MGYFGTRLTRHCMTKRKFPTKQEAEQFRRNYKPDQRVYRCQLCEQYHLCSTKKHGRRDT